jgi:hypothetical protein
MELENSKEAEAIIESAVRAKVKRLDLNFSHRYNSPTVPCSIGNLSNLEERV